MASFLHSIDFLTLNIRGLNNPQRLIEVCNIAKNYSKSKKIIITLQETKLTNMKETHLRILKQFNLEFEFVPAIQNAGGLLTLYSNTLKVIPKVKTQSVLVLALDHVGPGKNPMIANVYINPRDHKLESLKESLSEIDPDSNLIVLGDFNAIDINSNQLGKTPPKTNDIRVVRYDKICQILSNFNTYDFGKMLSFTDPTHYDKRTRTSNRIDYIFGNLESQNVEMYQYTTSFSDHKCLHLSYQNTIKEYKPGIWRLNDEILEDKRQILQILLTAYESDFHLPEKYDIFKARIRDDLRMLCIKNSRTKRILEKQLMKDVENAEYYLQTKSNITIDEIQKLEETTLKLKAFQQKEAEQISKALKNFYLDVSEGDPKATKNLVKCVTNRQEIKRIINRSGVEITDEDEILDSFAAFFQNCYQKNNESSDDEKRNKYLNSFFEKNKQTLENYERNSLYQNNDDNPFTEYEIEKAISKLNSKSAPGTDGLTSDLYKTQKDFFVPLLTSLFNNINLSNSVPPSFEQAIIKVIQKKPNQYNIDNFRPISLINTDQKILSHVIAERLKKVLDTLIGPHQTAHLSNRNIHTSLLKLQTFATKLSKHEGIVALDFNKAFDKVTKLTASI